MLSSVFTVAAVLLSFAVAQSDTVPVTGKLGNASVITNNPPGVVYTAKLPEKAFANLESNIKGSISAVADANGIGVLFTVDFSNFPKTGGPFLYHLHDAPVPSDGNCTGTLAHLDPYQRGETPPCDHFLPQTCQVGDLSGKNETIPNGAEIFQRVYNDSYASTLQGIGSFFGNRSITLHYANKTRITCANFTLESGGGGAPGGSSSSASLPSSSSASTVTSTVSGQTTPTSAPSTSTVVAPPSGGAGTGSGAGAPTGTGSPTGPGAGTPTNSGTPVAGTSAPPQFTTASAPEQRPAIYAVMFGAAALMAWML